MEFDELRKIWDTQNNTPMYVINEQTLHNRILSKVKTGAKITNQSELASIIVNCGAGLLLIRSAFSDAVINYYLMILGAWMIFSSGIILISRIKRIRGEQEYDRTVLGDLDHALSYATYQVKLSGWLRWNIVPMILLMVPGMWDGGKHLVFITGLIIFFVVTAYMSGLEHNHYKRRKDELAALKQKLTEAAPTATE